MIKYYLLFISLFISAIVMVGCVNGNVDNELKKESNQSGLYVDYGLSLITVDSCQYVIYIGSEKAAMVHSGNCHNLKHLKHE